MRRSPAPTADQDQRLVRILTVACFAVLAAMSVLFVLTVAVKPAESAVAAQASAPSRAYAPDAYRMVQWCEGGAAVYASPDGRLWMWLEGWTPMKPGYSTAEFCDAPTLQLR